MGKIKKILEKELGSTQSVEVYPVTSIEAVYDENNERLDNIINRKNKEIQKELEAEVTRASNAESNLRETINNITEINENVTSANIVTIDNIPNTSSSNVQQALNELYATFASVDDVPVEDSNNFVKSSGISLATKYSKKEINNLELLYANKYISSGSLKDGNNYNLYYLDISDYTDEVISINGNNVYYSLWGLAKKDGDNIEIIHTSESRISSATINLSEYKIYGANILLVCNNRNLVVLRDHYSSITNQLNSSINNSTVQTYAPINTHFNIGKANVGDVINMTHIATVISGHNITSTVCDCEEGEVFYVTSKYYTNVNYSGHHIVILDNNNAVVWRPYNNISFDNYKIVIPQNGKKIIATNAITKIEKQTVYKNKEVYADYYGERLNVFLTNGRIGGNSDSIASLSIGDTIESLTITSWYSWYRSFCCYCKEGDFFTYTAKNAVPTICVAFFDENLRLLKKEYAYNSNVHFSAAPAQSAICYMWFTYASDQQGTAINTTFDVLKNSYKASFNYWNTVNKNFGDLLNNQVETIKSILSENSYSMLNSSLENYLAISHRGYMPEAPENTLPGYKCAKQHGFDYSETDVLFTSDNVPVCIHDDTINRTALNADGTVISETIRVDSLTLTEIEQYDFSRITKNTKPDYPFTKIPTLKEFLTLCRNIGLHPYIELKVSFSTEQINIICDTVREVGLIGKVTYISYSANNLKLVKDNYPICRLGLLSDRTDQNTVNTAAALKNEYNYVFLNINYSFLTQSVVTMCKTAGIRLETWVTAFSSNETAEKILALDPYINGVTANALNAKTIIYEKNIN